MWDGREETGTATRNEREEPAYVRFGPVEGLGGGGCCCTSTESIECCLVMGMGSVSCRLRELSGLVGVEGPLMEASERVALTEDLEGELVVSMELSVRERPSILEVLPGLREGVVLRDARLD